MANSIERTLELKATPERVWRALTEPDELSAWFGDSAELDLRPGGAGAFGWTTHGRFAVQVEEVEAPRRLAWRWAKTPDRPLDDGPSTTVEWELVPRGDGGTTLKLRESGFVSDEHREENVRGWKSELAELEAHLES